MTSPDAGRWLAEAFGEAQRSYDSGGLPIGAVLVEGDRIVGRGHNRRVQDGDPIAHGEMSCLRDAGRRRSYATTTLVTTLSPCMMCAGAIVQFGIPHVVVGEAQTFPGNAGFLRKHGVTVTILDDERCIELMRRFQAERPELWDEDIAGRVET